MSPSPFRSSPTMRLRYLHAAESTVPMQVTGAKGATPSTRPQNCCQSPLLPDRGTRLSAGHGSLPLVNDVQAEAELPMAVATPGAPLGPPCTGSENPSRARGSGSWPHTSTLAPDPWSPALACPSGGSMDAAKTTRARAASVHGWAPRQRVVGLERRTMETLVIPGQPPLQEVCRRETLVLNRTL